MEYYSDIYTMEYYSVIKKNLFESVLMRWLKLEPIIQNEVSQKDYCFHTHTHTHTHTHDSVIFLSSFPPKTIIIELFLADVICQIFSYKIVVL